MLRQGLLILAFTQLISTLHAYPKVFKSQDFLTTINHIDHKELNAAKSISTYYKNLKKNKPTKSKHFTQIKNSTLFKRTSVFIQELESKNFCSKNLNRKHTFKDGISKLLFTAAKNRCFENFTSNLSKKDNITNQDLNFIKTYYKDLLKDPHNKEIANKLTNNSIQATLLKEFIKTKYLSKEIYPSSHIIEQLVIDKDLTKLLQEINYYSKQDKVYLKNTANRLFREIRNHIKQNLNERARSTLSELINFHSMNKELLKGYDFDKKLHYIARLTLRSPDMDLQEDIFRFSQKFNEENSFNETIFQIIFKHVNEEDSYRALKFVRDKKLLEKIEELDSKNRYWIARAFEYSREITNAKEIYIKQIELVPFSFYSILALERLKVLNPSYSTKFLVKESNDDKLFLPSPRGRKEIQKLNIWLTLGHYQFYHSQKDDFLKNCEFIFPRNDKESLSCHEFVIKLFSLKGQYIESFKLAYKFLGNDKIEFDGNLISVLFPKRYLNIINKGNVEEKVILSLMRQESGFNRYARSPAGARGLMQLMPATARMYKRNLPKKKLYNPELNIKIGTKYLKYLLKKYDGNLTFVFAAYNAGEGNLSRWIKKGLFNGNNLENIEKIPFHETRMYVKLLYRNMFYYNMLTKNRKVSSINSQNSLLNYSAKH